MQIKKYNQVFMYDTEFPLRVSYQMQTPTPFHFHEFVELIIILAGYGVHQTKFSRNKIHTGDVVVIPRNGEHRYAEANGLELLNVLFDPNHLPLPLLDIYKLPGYSALFGLENDFFENKRFYPKFHIEDDDFKTIRLILSEMRQESENRIPGYRCCQMGYFMALLANLCRLYTENLDSVHEPSLNIGRIISYLNSNYQKNISLPEIMQWTGMSKSTLMRNFKQATGSTPIDYLIRIRIAKASCLLLESSLSISEIAYQVGFADSNYFSRSFREITGMTPRAFRQKETSENS